MHTIQQAYSAKIYYSFLLGGSLWSRFMTARYPDENVRASDSLIRRRMWTMKAFVEDNLMSSAESIIWAPSTYGDFTLSSAYDFLRPKRGRCLSSASIWGRFIPSKISVFMWKLLRRLLPFPDVIERFGYCVPSVCPFCVAASASLEHCLFGCNEAQRVWTFFSRLSGLNLGNSSTIRTACHAWWLLAAPDSAVGSFSCLLPCLILWFLWVAYTDCLYNGSRYSSSEVIRKIKRESYLISLACPPRNMGAFGFCLQAEGLIARFAIPRGVRHSGSSVGAAGGACLRDSRGLLVAGICFRLDVSSALEAEVLALRKALQWCDTMVLRPYIIEVDSLQLVRLASSSDAMPWKLQEAMFYIRTYVAAWGAVIKHAYREANSVADALAAEGLVAITPSIFRSFNALPTKAKLALLYDYRGFTACRTIPQ
ncbi:PREDICTED: uncharacterized protein LOC109189813 [Ipomoea nil]|uniref:uncharacterized protein LOC109189813 n=1 Tax=Ipomoea nil TaxID=35883 RepID=UPI000901DCE5|nr:PREDICTED: uncharacterized protein LOC109189813 [Ipomoea nil]